MAFSSCNFRCENPECMKEYSSYSNLFRNYREYKQHKPENLESKKKPNAKEIVKDVLLLENLSQYTRSARANAFVSCLSDDEVKECFLKRAVNIVSPWEFLLARNALKQSVNETKLFHDFIALRKSLFSTFPDMKLLAAESVIVNSPEISNVEDMVKFVLKNEKLLCKALLEAENGNPDQKIQR